MIPRLALDNVIAALGRQAAVALLGPRQVGKTTLALEVGHQRPSVYLDLEDADDRAKLAEPKLFFAAHENALVILDEVHRVPELFQTLRGVIDRGRRDGRGIGRFLVLGSAAIDLLRQSGESLAGRIAYLELGPVRADEFSDPQRLWLRGGFPNSLLAENDAQSLVIRRDLVRTYLERDVPMFGPRVPAETLSRLWTMIAHLHGTPANGSALARNLSISPQSVSRYVDLLCDLLLVRRLQPFHANVGKRLVKSPKLFIRDSGVLHALLGIGSLDALLAHPVIGASWEGFVIENLLAVAPFGTHASFYRTAAGAEVDLVLELPGAKRWAIEIKHGTAPKLGRGFHQAREDLDPTHAFVVYGGEDRYPIGDSVEVISLRTLMNELKILH